MPFEGKEKRLEILFSNHSKTKSLRDVSIAIWTDIIHGVKASVLQCCPSTSFDAFVLSESSMFVYDTKVLLITCGQTTILSALEQVCALGKQMEMEIDRIQYSHSNFTFPMLQQSPHSNVELETAFLKSIFRDVHFTEVASTHGLGWYCWTLCHSKCQVLPTCTLYLENISRQAANEFTQNTIERSGLHMLQHTKLSGLLQAFGPVLHAYAFHPCGLSANGICTRTNGHWTLHITPEVSNSFVSLEFCPEDVSEIQRIASFFEYWKPQKAQVITSSMPTSQIEVTGYECVSKTTLLMPMGVDVQVFGFRVSVKEDNNINIDMYTNRHVDNADDSITTPTI